MENWERVAKMIGIEPTLSTAPKDTPAPKMPAGAKQYCRYCCFCTDLDFYYCNAKEKALSEHAIKQANTCKDFALNGIDIITGKQWKLVNSQQSEPFWKGWKEN